VTSHSGGAHRRRFPLARWWNLLAYLVIDRALAHRLRVFARGRLVDIGCGAKPYAAMASPTIMDHVGVDTAESPHGTARVDVIATAYDTGLPDASFDTLLCTDVLEHLEEPQRAINEAFRLLRPGGYAIYTVPLFWHLHEEPRDFYRYTRHGLIHLFRTAGFEVTEVVALTGFIATFTQSLVYFLKALRRGGPINPLWWLVPPVALVIQGIAYGANFIDPTTRFSMEYIAVARRPTS
jgi:SAM-dependent methyltransferase